MTGGMGIASGLTVAVLAVATRIYKIDAPDHVCWDEAHFGKFASHYINRTFFFDVHPPLGKMIIALSGYMTGYDGRFSFKDPGVPYGGTNYIGMRVVCAVFGSTVPIFIYGIMEQLTHSTKAAFLSALLLIFDTGTLVLSRFILLDPILIGFLAATLFSYVKFRNMRVFSTCWWFYLFCCGVFMSCTTGVKFVGLFLVKFIGLSTVAELWCVIGDTSVPWKRILQHFAARALCLIGVPVALYLLFFAVHFMVLSKSGPGDGFYSSAFQSLLQGNPLHNVSRPHDVAYGSHVTLKNHRVGGAYLHSHWHLYPEHAGPAQQQVTCYSHKDRNNEWRVKRYDVEPGDDVILVTHGDLIRLEHIMTRRNLHSHVSPAPVTSQHQQVSCYGQNGTGDSNDVFRIEIVDAHEFPTLKAMTSLFRLIHVNTGCALHSHSVQLPKWGWDQLEVSCNPDLHSKGTLWNIEQVFDSRLPNASFSVYAPSFISKVIESHAVMLQNNAGLTAKQGEVTSQPWEWPLNYRGQPFSGGETHIYLLGNPVVFLLNLVSVIAYFVLYLYDAFTHKRGLSQCSSHINYKVLGVCNWLFLGWLLHYMPFWLMSRVLYFHHYFPAFLFSSMLSGVITVYLIDIISFQVFVGSQAKLCNHVLNTVLHAVIVYSFLVNSPLAYGMNVLALPKGPLNW